MEDKEKAFSNRDKDVFLISLDRGIDRGALISRYSRAAALDIRDVYDKEFAENSSRGSEFYRKVFSEYGDESIAELISAQLGIQNVSNVVTKILEEQRIGLSFIEKSSRYVRYDKKVDDGYLYLKPERIGISGKLASDYTDLCDSLFSFYAKNYEPLKKIIQEKYPSEGCIFTSRKSGSSANLGSMDSEERKLALRAYDTAVRARALDDLRYVLPASTLTNLGISGNARAFTYLLAKLRASGLQEAKQLAQNIFDELRDEFAEIIKTSDSISPAAVSPDAYAAMDAFAAPETLDNPTVKLIAHSPENEELRRMGLAISVASGNYGQIDIETVKSWIKNSADTRASRRDKPGREYEIPSYHFLVLTNYGAFRDLQRHRMMTIIRGRLSTSAGYDVPEIIANNLDMLSEFNDVMKRSVSLWENLRASYGSEVAQYCVPYAFRYPIYMVVNMRELVHFTELRSTPQAHYDLRKIAVKMHEEVSKVHPSIALIAKFVDAGEYPLGRIFSEFRKEKKLA
ncbi:MAG: FAD-dependent thymidylate synthase [Candidatus Thermoplasmatota archaeon]|nr:FAD-dependent thymidylate synthase [Candidatus Thermoplasmatota archaeon]